MFVCSLVCGSACLFVASRRDDVISSKKIECVHRLLVLISQADNDYDDDVASVQYAAAQDD